MAGVVPEPLQLTPTGKDPKVLAGDERNHCDYICRENERLKPTGAALPQNRAR